MKILKHENHARLGGRHDVAAHESLRNHGTIEKARGYFVPRLAIGIEDGVVAPERDHIRVIAADRVSIERDDGLLLGLGPDTLAVEKTSESDLNLQREPGEQKNHADKRHQRIGQWQQTPRQGSLQPG
ncbi:MAG: hypothetical protein ACTHL5_05435 [Rhodanobacter sp.]